MCDLHEPRLRARKWLPGVLKNTEYGALARPGQNILDVFEMRSVPSGRKNNDALKFDLFQWGLTVFDTS